MKKQIRKDERRKDEIKKTTK